MRDLLLRAAVALTVIATAVPLTAPMLSAQGGWVCGAYDQTAKRGRTPTPDANGKVFPVVTIHGITGSDDDFDGTIDKSYVGARPEPPRTLLDALAGATSGDLPPGLTGAHVFSFSYTPDSLRWVDHAAVGQRFATTIDCLHERFGAPVSVVAHSMGGLVTRWVANTQDADGVSRSTKLGKVLTLGTPYQGSALSSLANGATNALESAGGPAVAMLNLLCGARGTASGKGNCGPIPLYASFRSEAGRNLQAGSPQLAALRPWPADTDVSTLAGSQMVPMALLGSPIQKQMDVGDLAVGTGSATADPAAGRIFTCSYDSATASYLSEWKEILRIANPEERRSKLANAFLNSPCYHGNLMRYVELTNEVLGQLDEWLTANRSTTAPASCPVVQVGEWRGSWRSTRNPNASGTLDAALELAGAEVGGSLSVSGSTTVPGGGISGTVDCERVTFGRVDALVEFSGEVAPSGASISGTYRASDAAGGDIGTFELDLTAGGSTRDHPGSVEELISALESAWVDGAFDSMTAFASPSAVSVARMQGPITGLDPVDLSSCFGGSSGVGWCELLVDPGGAGYALIYSFAFIESGPDRLEIAELQFQGDAG